MVKFNPWLLVLLFILPACGLPQQTYPAIEKAEVTNRGLEKVGDVSYNAFSFSGQGKEFLLFGDDDAGFVIAEFADFDDCNSDYSFSILNKSLLVREGKQVGNVDTGRCKNGGYNIVVFELFDNSINTHKKFFQSQKLPLVYVTKQDSFTLNFFQNGIHFRGTFDQQDDVILRHNFILET